MNNLFKGIDNMTLLSYITLVLSIAIFLSIIFGCTYKKRFERFETKETKETKETEETKKKEFDLTEDEKALLEGLQNGTINEDKLETFISEEKVTKKSVEKLIDHIQNKVKEQFKDKAKK